MSLAEGSLKSFIHFLILGEGKRHNTELSKEGYAQNGVLAGSYAAVLTPGYQNVTVFADKAFKEVIKSIEMVGP